MALYGLHNKTFSQKQTEHYKTDRNDGEEESACWPGERGGGMSYKDITVGRTRGLDPADELPVICSSQ